MIKRFWAWILTALLTVTSGLVMPTVAWAAELPAGDYPVQQVTYDDGDGSYGLMVLNTPKGVPPLFSTEDLQMARLTDEAIAEGKTAYFEHDGDNNILYLTPDFKIEYVHNETETVTDPQTGQPQTVVVRQQSSFWQPFSAVLAANAVSNMLFGPRYYMPPVYSPTGLMGYGGVGTSYNAAVTNYRDRNNAPPAAVKNRTQLRTSGKVSRNNRKGSGRKATATPKNNLKNNSKNNPKKKLSFGDRIRQRVQGNRSSGSGVGGSNLKRSQGARSQQARSKSNSFGSNRSSRPSNFGSRSMSRPRSFGGRRRR